MSSSDQIWRATASWNRTSRFWLAWPKATGHRDHDEIARDDSVALAQLLAAHAPVTMVAHSADVVPCSLQMPSGVKILAADSGAGLLSAQPVWLTDGAGAILAGVACDSVSGRDLAQAAGVGIVDLPAGWQGDLIETDGEGSALVLSCLADGLDGGRSEAERLLREKLGIVTVIWLDDPRTGPGTGPGTGRVPARFLAPGIVAVPGGHTAQHPAFAALSANRDRLRVTSDRMGRSLNVIDLPCPNRTQGCYSDCMVAGDLVLVPEFEESRDAQAFAQVVAALPDARVVGFPASHLAAPGAGLGRSVLAQPKLN